MLNDCIHIHAKRVYSGARSLVAPVPQVALGTQTQVCMN